MQWCLLFQYIIICEVIYIFIHMQAYFLVLLVIKLHKYYEYVRGFIQCKTYFKAYAIESSDSVVFDTRSVENMSHGGLSSVGRGREVTTVPRCVLEGRGRLGGGMRILTQVLILQPPHPQSSVPHSLR